MAEMQKTLITKEGLEKMQKELEDLLHHETCGSSPAFEGSHCNGRPFRKLRI